MMRVGSAFWPGPRAPPACSTSVIQTKALTTALGCRSYAAANRLDVHVRVHGLGQDGADVVVQHDCKPPPFASLESWGLTRINASLAMGQQEKGQACLRMFLPGITHTRRHNHTMNYRLGAGRSQARFCVNGTGDRLQCCCHTCAYARALNQEKKECIL